MARSKFSAVIITIALILLFLSIILLSISSVYGQQILLSDSFVSDSSLRTDIWQANGVDGRVIFSDWQSSQGNPCNLVDPNPAFSIQGMSINAVNSPYQFTTIETKDSFSAPFTLQCSVMATSGGSTPFFIWLTNQRAGGLVGFSGVFNESSPNFGIWNDFEKSFLVNRLVASPTLSTVYQLTITVGSDGTAKSTVSSNGLEIGSTSGQRIGADSFKIVLGQREGNVGIGPNQAFWKTITLTSIAENSTPTPIPSQSPTPTLMSTATATPPASTTPTATGIITSSPSPTQSSEPAATVLNFPTEVLAGFIIVATLTLLVFLIYRFKKTRRVAPQSTIEPKISPSKFLLLGLLAAVFSIDIIDIFVPILRPEIAASFGVSTATAFQLTAFAAIAGVLTGLALSALSIRMRYKTILLAGVFSTILCTVGFYFAQSFVVAQIFYALNGVGTVAVSAMAIALVGELYPNDKKAMRMSWIMVTGQFATFVGSPIVGLIANTNAVTSWRNVLVWFEIPATVTCFLLVLFLVPNKQLPSRLGSRKAPFMDGFRQVLTNRSAIACMASSFLAAVLAAVNSFAPAFLKEVFSVEPFLRSLVPVAATLLIMTGMFAGGMLINRVGRKRFAIFSALPANICVFIGYPITLLVPSVWALLSFRFTAALIGGMALVAGPVLVMDQIPKYRGTLLSLTSALGGIGLAFGALLGSGILGSIANPQISYPVAMAVLGIFGIVQPLILLFFAKDPIKDLQQTLVSQ